MSEFNVNQDGYLELVHSPTSSVIPVSALISLAQGFDVKLTEDQLDALSAVGSINTLNTELKSVLNQIRDTVNNSILQNLSSNSVSVAQHARETRIAVESLAGTLNSTLTAQNSINTRLANISTAINELKSLVETTNNRLNTLIQGVVTTPTVTQQLVSSDWSKIINGTEDNAKFIITNTSQELRLLVSVSDLEPSHYSLVLHPFETWVDTQNRSSIWAKTEAITGITNSSMDANVNVTLFSS